ncbi:NAD(P)-dependent oxidoreductase [Hellea balneolensis]|uniref:NAD(P)-dependent oxidoreductase n=1 Tax=Hellea balneolensis TaxID=287478 RepID=UPI0004049BAB|nr:NAD(P)-dependent oxidoreductase [Hellea balneolensis]
MARCAFLGLGVMGYPMAGHLLRAGHQVTVWNRTKSKSKLWSDEYDGQFADTIEEAVKNADFVMICVGDDPDVYAVVTPALKVLEAGSIIVDHTTASAECARECHGMAMAKGIGFVDAPISGGEAGAVNGQLTIMCGGDKEDYIKAEPIMEPYAKAMKLMGLSGAGQLTKMVNQICIAGILQGLAEGVHFAQKAGLDIDEVIQAIGKGAAQSWQMDNRASTMGRDEYDFGFAVDWMRKDLGITLKTAKDVGAELVLTKMVDEYYSDVQEMGGNRWDTSSLLKRLS